MKKAKRIGLVAHDNRKKDLLEWVEWNWKMLTEHELICTGTTGKLIEEFLVRKTTEAKVKLPRIGKLKSGPLGGDQQLGALIVEGKIDMLIFLWDPMQPQPHDVDVKALLRITVLYNIPTACNRASADLMISSPLLNTDYKPILKDYSSYIQRSIEF
ncbi:MAG: methylglyoxal synthase [Bacteroidales bacterium]|nr:methylglyoxal synthase [Bacteroidales bacterium]MBN2762655.1 methylglyoxal synthase [Bacteroidales bacterium]